MKKIIFGLIALLAIGVAVVLLLPQLIPVSTYKPTLEEKASEALGRSVTIGDDLSIKIFPKAAFRVTQLQVDNPAGFSTPYLMRVEKAEIGVDLFKLLSKEVEINRFVLTGPDINIEKNKSGAVNYELGSDKATDNEEASGENPELNDLRLGDVRIVDGKANYIDAVAKQNFAMDDIDVDITLTSLETPFDAKGTMNFQGEPARLDLVMTTPGKVLRKEETNMKLALDVGDTSMGGDLKINFGDKVSFSGPVNFNAPNLPALAALAGSPLPEAPGFDKFSVSGQLSGNPDLINLSGATIKFDDVNATGDLRLALSGARPKATGTIRAEALDLRPYLPPPPADTPAGFPAWSSEKMDLSSLRTIDADLAISTANIYVNDIVFGESEMTLKIQNGRMTADIPKMAMYEGNGSGRMVVNARSNVPSFAGNFTMSKVNAEPFCLDVLKTGNLLGLGGFNFNFTASGASQAAIMSSLDGNGGFDVNDGALKGFNIAKLARTASGFKEGINPATITNAISSVQGSGESTDFSSFLSKFTMTNGVMNVPTINMDSPILNMIGSGTIDLPNQTIDLRLEPTASLNADGSGGNGLKVPVRVTGTFSAPKVAVDVQSLLRGAAGKRLRGVIDGAVGDKLKDSPAGGLLNGVLDNAIGGGTGNNSGSDSGTGTKEGDDKKPASAEEQVEEAAKNAIGSLFGRKKKK